MIEIVMKIIMTYSCLSFLPVIYFINNILIKYQNLIKISNIRFFKYYISNQDFTYFIISITLFLSSSIISLCICHKNRSVNIGSKEELLIVEIKQINSDFLPSYLGYFFVALSIQNIQALLFIFITLFIFIYRSQIFYFNPFFLIIGYKYYEIKDDSSSSKIVISKRDITTVKNLYFDSLTKINNYTFMDID